MKTKTKKKLNNKQIFGILAIAILAAVILLVIGRNRAEPENEYDPYAGQVEVYNGAKNVWIVPEAGVPVNTLSAEDFVTDENGEPQYIGSEYRTLRGIDVSRYQNKIDWQTVADSGIDFAIIRAGIRGYGSEGTLAEDTRFVENLENAQAAGLKVGAYFFSQAITPEEAKAEAELALSMLEGHKLQLPVFFDWERIALEPDARTNGLGQDMLTECAVAFCETIENGGYDAGIYFNLDTSYYGYEMSRLTDYDFWCASPGDYPYCYYAHSIWQYSFNGKVAGIDATCDMNMMFVKK